MTQGAAQAHDFSRGSSRTRAMATPAPCGRCGREDVYHCRLDHGHCCRCEGERSPWPASVMPPAAKAG